MGLYSIGSYTACTTKDEKASQLFQRRETGCRPSHVPLQHVLTGGGVGGGSPPEPRARLEAFSGPTSSAMLGLGLGKSAR